MLCLRLCQFAIKALRLNLQLQCWNHKIKCYYARMLSRHCLAKSEAKEKKSLLDQAFCEEPHLQQISWFYQLALVQAGMKLLQKPEISAYNFVIWEWWTKPITWQSHILQTLILALNFNIKNLTENNVF